MTTTPLRQRPAWKALETHYQQVKALHLRQLFADDPAARRAPHGRGRRHLSRLLQEPHHRRNAASSCCNWPRSAGLRDRIDAMFRGDKINVTENRAVLHVALRAPQGAVHRRRRRERRARRSMPCSTRWPPSADRVRSGAWKGHTGKRIRNVVNIGIGGSDLGPVMAYEALKHYSDRSLTFRFVSNVDGTDFAEATRDLDPAETLFIISSKTFTTLETMTNAHTARDWCCKRSSDETAVAKHFVAVSTNAKEVAKFGIDTANMFELLGLGRRPLFDGFGHRPLDDARHRPGQLPRHARRLSRDGRAFPHRAVREEPAGAAGAAGVWYDDFFGAQTVAVLPYEQYLKRFPAYLQQLTMESNGKHVTLDGDGGRLPDRGRSTGASRAPTASTPSTS